MMLVITIPAPINTPCIAAFILESIAISFVIPLHPVAKVHK